MRDIALIVLGIVGLAVVAELYIPLVGFTEVVMVGLLIAVLVLVDVVVKVTQALFGGGSKGE